MNQSISRIYEGAPELIAELHMQFLLELTKCKNIPSEENFSALDFAISLLKDTIGEECSIRRDLSTDVRIWFNRKVVDFAIEHLRHNTYSSLNSEVDRKIKKYRFLIDSSFSRGEIPKENVHYKVWGDGTRNNDISGRVLQVFDTRFEPHSDIPRTLQVVQGPEQPPEEFYVRAPSNFYSVGNSSWDVGQRSSLTIHGISISTQQGFPRPGLASLPKIGGIEFNPTPTEPPKPQTNQQKRFECEKWYVSKPKNLPPQNWYEWIQRKPENLIGYMIMFFSSAKYPLDEKNAKYASEFIIDLVDPQNRNSILIIVQILNILGVKNIFLILL